MNPLVAMIARERQQKLVLCLAEYSNDALKELEDKINSGEWSRDELRELWEGMKK